MEKLEQLKIQLRELIARLKELRGKATPTEAEVEERKGLFDKITAKNEELEEEQRAVDLLKELDTSFEEPPAGGDPESRSRADVKDKPIYRSFGAQIQDILVVGGQTIGDVSPTEARKRLAENDKRSIAIIGKNGSEARADAVSVTDSASGGGLVQTDFAFDVVEKGFNNSVIPAKCSERTLTSGANALDIHGMDEDSRKTGARYGGIQVFTKREMENYEESKAKFTKIGMKIDKITGLLYLSDEIAQDAGFLESEITDLFPKAFGFKLQDLVLMAGTGAGEPLAVYKSKAMLTIAKESGQAAKSITAKNISDMKAAAAGNAEWYANRDIIPELDTLISGTDAAAKRLFKQTSINSGLLDGIPITFIEQAETLGTNGDLTLADFSEYVLLRKGGLTKAESLHFKFDQGLKAIRWEMRLDGQPRWKKPLTPYKGTNKISPFVSLATRG